MVGNYANGFGSVASQNLSSNYGKVLVAGSSIQTTFLTAGSTVTNTANGSFSHAVQNIASNDACNEPQMPLDPCPTCTRN